MILNIIIIIIIIIVKRVQTPQPRLYVNTIRTRVCRWLQYILLSRTTTSMIIIIIITVLSHGPCPKSLRFVYWSIGVQTSSWKNLPGNPILHHTRSFLSNRKRSPIVVVFFECLSHDFDSDVVRVRH